MNSKRMRFSILVLAVYAVLGVVGVFSQAQTSGDADSIPKLVEIVAPAERGIGSSGGDASAEESLQWHSFLPGSFR
jgi:hypothetical protein